MVHINSQLLMELNDQVALHSVAMSTNTALTEQYQIVVSSETFRTVLKLSFKTLVSNF